MRVAPRIPISLCSHIGATRTYLRTHTLPPLMGELHRLAAHVARGVRTMIMRSPGVSNNLLETSNLAFHLERSVIVKGAVSST